MADAKAVILDHRGVLRVGGDDRVAFLQGIVSNDVTRVTPNNAIWAAFLTPQGKFLHEFFLAAEGESFLLDCEAGRAGDLARRLKLYKLRAKATIEAVEGLSVTALFGADALARLDLPAEPGRARPLGGGLVFIDPRLPELGARALLPKEETKDLLEGLGFAAGTLADYDQQRLARGVPDGSRDLEVEKATLLESGFDELHGIDWDKGCYMGQELTARMHYRGLTKKRLLPVAIAGPAPEPGTAITRDGKAVGNIRSAVTLNGEGSAGLALLRLDALENGDAPLRAGEAQVTAKKPDWAKF